MKNRFKRLCALLLTGILLLSCIPAATAAVEDDTISQAKALQELRLFRGTDQGFELERVPTRMEALVMMLRLSGQEWKALYGEEPMHPFTDAPSGWEGADAYLSYAYENKLTQGAAPTLFLPQGRANAQMYITFVLRALGYQDDATLGTVYDNWRTLAAKAGILPEGVNLTDFRRSDLVQVSYAALDAKVQGTETTLAESLLSQRLISDVSLATAHALTGKSATADSPLADILGTVYAGTDVGTSRFTSTQITKDNLSYYLGVDKLDFAEGLASEPMMTSTAHSVCLVRLKDGSNVEQIKKDIAAKVNPYKWICAGVESENVRVDSIDNLVILVMDNTAADSLIANFQKLGDGTGLVQVGSSFVEKQAAVDTRSVTRFAEKLTALREKYFSDRPVVYATIPDKSFYAKTSSPLDHSAIAAQLKTELSDWKTVDLASLLALDDYYQTDPHWRQDSLFPVVNALGKAMDFTVDLTAFTTLQQSGFAGAYRLTQPSLPTETVQWMVSPYTKSAVVNDFQHPKVHTVYNPEMFNNKTSYDFFLSGPSPLITIENPLATSTRELVIFRDSYAGNLTPLLIEPYAKITLVDLRYMVSSLLPDYVKFDNAEVLFLYSDHLVNNSTLLK